MKAPKPNRRLHRETAVQVLYCQVYSQKDLLASAAAVESVRTIEAFQETMASLREIQAATDGVLRALEHAVSSLVQAATPDGKRDLKASTEGTVDSRLHLAETRRDAADKAKALVATMAENDPLFTEDGFTLRLLRTYNRYQDRIDSTLDRSLEGWSLKRLTAEDGAVLRLGITELLYFEDVPAPVIIDEYVELARAFGDKDSTKLTNAVLDRVRKDNPRESK